VRVRQKGSRTKSLVVATAPQDRGAVTAGDLAEPYRCRWQAERDLRALQESLPREVLRGLSPGLVRQGVGAHLLVYNVTRGLRARAGWAKGVRPGEVRFRGAVQAARAFRPQRRAARGAAAALRRVGALLRAIGEPRVGDRPDRCAPRATTRRPKNYPYRTVPRAQSRARLAASA